MIRASKSAPKDETVVVTHEELEKSEQVDVIDGEAYVEIVSESAIITLLDSIIQENGLLYQG